MTSPEFYQEGQKKEGGIWRLLAIGITIAVVLAIINDAISASLAKG